MKQIESKSTTLVYSSLELMNNIYKDIDIFIFAFCSSLILSLKLFSLINFLSFSIDYYLENFSIELNCRNNEFNTGLYTPEFMCYFSLVCISQLRQLIILKELFESVII